MIFLGSVRRRRGLRSMSDRFAGRGNRGRKGGRMTRPAESKPSAIALPALLSVCLFVLVAHGSSGLLRAQGHFRVENRQGAWWLIWPDGTAGLSIGVDTI